MKQTAVEWLIEEIECRGLVTKELRLAFEQAKEMEKQQQDDFAVKFGEYLDSLTYQDMGELTVKKLLEIYKQQL